MSPNEAALLFDRLTKMLECPELLGLEERQ